MNIPFSVVTTCRNEMRSLERWKRNLLEQTRQPDEIVIVDAFSDDGTFEHLSTWAQADPRVRLLQEKGAAAHGRNVAIENARYEHILSTDMGVRLSNNWCEELIKPFEADSTVEVVLGNSCIDVETVRSVVARAEVYLEDGGFVNPRPGTVGGNRSSAYLRRIWQELGGLPEDLTFYADDSVFFRQINQGQYRQAYALDAMTFWGRPQLLKAFCRECFVYGRGDGEAAIKMSGSFKLYLRGWIPKWVEPYCNGLRQMQKSISPKVFGRALKKADVSGALMIPYFAFLRGLHHSRGYHIGYIAGTEKCYDARSRLNPTNTKRKHTKLCI